MVINKLQAGAVLGAVMVTTMMSTSIAIFFVFPQLLVPSVVERALPRPVSWFKQHQPEMHATLAGCRDNPARAMQQDGDCINADAAASAVSADAFLSILKE